MVPPKKYSAPAATMSSNGTTKLQKFGGSGDMSFQKKESGDVRKENRSQNSSGSFRTDSAISGNRMGGERTLQRWVPDAPPSQDLSLESSGLNSSNGKAWDQFAVNEQKFGLKTDYDPNIYTTTINKNDPAYKKRVEQADRIAREIEGSAATNSHVAEERVTDNVAGEAGQDEEDRYSGVRRQQDFPPLASANRSNKYTTPARRAPTAQSTVSGAPVDPAIISSQLARPDKLVVDKTKAIPSPIPAQAAPKADTSRPESPASNLAVKAETKASASATDSAAKVAPAAASAVKAAAPLQAKKVEVPSSLLAPMTTTPAGETVVPNATATIERDLNASFKNFATQQRTQVGHARLQKAKQDKEIKLIELKKFASSFKLTSAVPDDLIAIIAKDPAKQREIQERSKRDAEASVKVEIHVPIAPASDAKKNPVAPSANSINPPVNRQGQGMAGGRGFTSQSNFNVGGRLPNTNQRQNNGPSLHSKLRSAEGVKYHSPPNPNGVNNVNVPNVPGVFSPQLSTSGQARLPPTGPAMSNGDSRRSSAIGNQYTPKLNPNTAEFRPISFGGNMNSNAHPNSNSSPRVTPPTVNRPFLRSKPLPVSDRPSFIKDADVLEQLNRLPRPSTGKDWTTNAGIPFPFETSPVFKKDDENSEAKMPESFTKVFENEPPTVSPAQPSHAIPQVPHQHQLPFHLQQGAALAAPARPSPRQHQMQMNAYPHQQPIHYNNHDDHRMVPSHSAQSFQSPRLNNVPMAAYQSPMPPNAQMAYQQQPNMHYPMGPGGPAPHLNNRSFSNSGPQPHFYPQGGAVMPNQVLMQGQVNNGYMAPQGMVPGQQMPMQGSGPPYFLPPNGGGPPPPMSGANGYPSPGRGGAPMMMNQGSQQGQQPQYGMSPGMQFQQPGAQYPPQQPGPMNNMRGGFVPGQNYGTSPQQHMYQFNQQNRGPGGHYNNGGNKNYHQQQQGPHTPAQQHQVPTGPQVRPVESGEEAK